MYSKFFKNCLTALALALPGLANAQMPDCLNNGGFVYIHSGSSIYNWDPQQPFGANNPALNTINNPGGGLAVSEYLPSGGYKTFYTCVGNNYWYYDGTAWQNTGHNVGNTAAVNPGGGGGYLYNLVGGTGQVYVYDGTGNGTLLTTVAGFGGGGPYDLVGDKDGNWYILKLNGPQYLRKYDPAGNMLKEWAISGAPTSTAGGGFAIVCNDLYYHNNTALFYGAIGNDTVFVSQVTGGTIPSPSDFGSCELGSAAPSGGNDTSFYLYRGCYSGNVKFQITPTDENTVFTLRFSGNAQNGLDFQYLDTNFVIPANDSIKYLEIVPLLRSPSVGDRDLVIEVIGDNPCLGGGRAILRTINVNIKDSLEVAITSPPVTVCPGETITITATKDPILDHFWEPEHLLTGTSGLTVTAQPTLTTRYSIRVEYAGAPSTCPPVTKYYTATVEPYPVIKVPDDFIVCLTDSITFATSITPDNPGYKTTWIPANGFGNPSDVNSKFFDQPGTYTKILRVSTPVANCTKEEEFTITIMPPFRITELSNDTAMQYGDSIKLTAKGENAKIWVWNPTRSIQDYSNETITVWPKETTVYTAIVFDEFGCKDSGMVKVTVIYEPKLMIPNAFSPNGDGLNDIFKIEGVVYEKLNSFQVFDRYGMKVFETTNIDKGWDGTYLNGKPAAPGVYYYLIEMSNVDRQTFQFKGDVTLTR